METSETSSLIPVRANRAIRDLNKRKRLERLVFQSKQRGAGYFNVEFLHVPFSRRYIDVFHFLLDLSWWKLFIFLTFLYVFVHLIFGTLFFIGGLFDLSNITSTHESLWMTFLYCFFFSVDVMQTNGTFGIIVPVGVYERTIVTILSYFCYFWETVVCAFILGKVARPSKMKKNYLFSRQACLVWDEALGQWSFRFRFANVRMAKSPQMDVDLHLLLLIWDDGPESVGSSFTIHHLDYTVYEQTPLSKTILFAAPLLPLPHVIRHDVHPDSPFLRFVRKAARDDLVNQRFEFIVYCEGIDSATSDNYQTFYSYIPDDIQVGCRFGPCTFHSNKRRKFIVDYKLFHDIEPVQFGPEDDSTNTEIEETEIVAETEIIVEEEEEDD